MNRQDEGRLLRLTALVSVFFLLVNHLARPKAFAATQLLFDYHDGLGRRGFAGAVLNLFALPEITTGEIRLALVGVTLAGLLAVLVFLYRAMARDNIHAVAQDSIQGGAGGRAGMLLLILLINSHAMASFVGNVGYLDGLLVLFCVAALMTDATRIGGVLARLLAMGAGVLTHENMLPYFAMLLVFEMWLAGRRGAAFLPLALGVALVAGLAVFTGRSPDAAQAYGAWLQAKSAFLVDPEATVVAGRGLGENFALMADMRGTVQYKVWLIFDGLPLFGLSMWLIWVNLTMLGQAALRGPGLLMALAVLAPLSLNVIAFDVVRFGVASVLVAALASAVIYSRHAGARARLDHALTWPLVLLVMVLVSNIFTTQVNMAAGHLAQFPWIMIEHFNWGR